jgi:hypothetical protein
MENRKAATIRKLREEARKELQEKIRGIRALRRKLREAGIDTSNGNE